MDKAIWIIMAAAAGAGLPLQAALNSKLAKTGGSPLHAAMISFTVGVLALILFILFTSQNVSWKDLKDAPVYSWLGGLLGAFYVSVIIYSFPRIGPGLAFGLIIAGQLGVSMLLEHYQILGAKHHPVSYGRIGGLTLIILGVYITKRF